MWIWLHHLLEPHCKECRELQEEREICSSCETLKHQLEIANYEKKQLLQVLLDNNTKQSEERKEVNFDELKPRNSPWLVRKQMLEAEDREKAKALRRNQEEQEKAKANAGRDKSIEELEKDLGIPIEGAS